jgi:propionate CoA-transferase
VTRYTTSNFLRMKLGNALSARGLAPHIYESSEEAHHHLQDFAPGTAADDAHLQRA